MPSPGILFLVGLTLAGGAPEPGPCARCHSMSDQVKSWARSSHAKVARCEDCHLPQGALLKRGLASLSDGLRHAAVQSFRGTPALMRVREGGAQTLQANCLRCHGAPGQAGATPSTPATPRDSAHLDLSRACAGCHRDSPHGPPAARHGG